MSAMSRVYIGGLHGKTRERDVEKFFVKYGKLREILLKNGYGFVEFDDDRDAKDAVRDLDGRELLGERLRVELARGSRRRGGGSGDFRSSRVSGGRMGDRRDSGRNSRRTERFGPPSRTDYRLYVDNLGSNVSWQDLKDVMRKGGDVTFADKQGQREGIVEFATKADMKNALKKCDGLEVQGRRIKVTEERPGRSRSRSDSRSRSRSVSRSRSRSRSRSPQDKAGGSGTNKDSKKETSGGSDGRRQSGSRSPSRSVSRSRSRS